MIRLALPSSARPSAGAALLAQAAALRVQADALEALAAQLDTDTAPEPAPTVPAPLVSRHEASRLLSISLATLDRLDREGQPFVRVGDAKRYDVAAVLAWHQVRTAEEPQRLPAAPESEPMAARTGVRRVSVGGRGGARR